MLGQSGFMICLGCFKSHHNGLFSVGHGQTDTILGGNGHQSLLYFNSPSRVAGGWDYEKLLEQIQFDDEETWYQYHENQNLPPEIDEDNIDSDDTPTNESSSSEHEEFEDANDAESESSSTVTDNSEDPPPIPVRLPIDMNVRQNLAQELQHPEVQAAVDDLVGDLREFNSRHPKAPPLASTIYKRSSRNNSKPQNYATMDKEEIENRRKKK